MSGFPIVTRAVRCIPIRMSQVYVILYLKCDILSYLFDSPFREGKKSFEEREVREEEKWYGYSLTSITLSIIVVLNLLLYHNIIVTL